MGTGCRSWQSQAVDPPQEPPERKESAHALMLVQGDLCIDSTTGRSSICGPLATYSVTTCYSSSKKPGLRLSLKTPLPIFWILLLFP